MALPSYPFGGGRRDLMMLRNLLIHPRRCFSKSVEFHPKLKEMLNPPPPKVRPKSVPKLEEIKIPKRIERGETDILKALASTIGRDYTAAHYKYHDDPYLIPYSNLSKRSYALSKEAGRKAARWIRDEHPDLFEHREAEPPIEAFWPTPVFTEDSQVTEEDLKQYIDQGLYQESVGVYEVLKQKGTQVSPLTRQALLEMLSYHNEMEPVDEEWIEERWYRASSMSKDRLRNTWKTGGLADTIFQEIENPTVEAYSALIRGQAKFFNSERAWVTYQEVKGKGFILDTQTYNALLKVTNFLRENAETRFQLLEELLAEMSSNSVQPNLGTLNSILETLAMIGNPKAAKNMALSVLAEFKGLGIEPSLASYYYLLMGFCKDRGPVSTILVDIMKHIKGQEFKIQDPKDIYFFVMAMEVARNHLQNVEVAYEVDALLHVGDNYDLIGDSFMESVYYRHFTALRCNSEPFDEFMTWYSRMVPNIYTPEPGIMEEILKALELNTAITYIPQLWSDIVIFEQSNRESLLTLLLHTMATYYPSSLDDLDLLEQERLKKEFTSISWKIWGTVESLRTEALERGRGVKLNWTGGMLGNLLLLQVRGDEFQNASEIIKKLLSPASASEVVGVPSIDSLKAFLDKAVEKKNGAMALACLRYMDECGYPEVKQYGEEVFTNLKDSLDSLQTAKLSEITGADFSLRLPKEDEKDKFVVGKK